MVSRSFKLTTIALLISPLFFAAGGIVHAQALSARNTIRLGVGQERTLTGMLKPQQKRRYKVLIGKPGGTLLLDHIKRDTRLSGNMYDAQGSSRSFDFSSEHNDSRIEPGNYVLELIGEGASGGFYSFRLRLAAGDTQDRGVLETISLVPGQSRYGVDGTIKPAQTRRYKIIVKDPGGIFMIDEVKKDMRLRINLYDSNGSLSKSDLIEAPFEKAVEPGSYLLELVNEDRSTRYSSQGHYMFRLNLRPR